MKAVHTTVFADGPGGGARCAVVFGAERWSIESMQQLAARWARDTAFVLPAEAPGADLRVRCFLPHQEVEMGVHAMIATLTALAESRTLRPGPLYIETVFAQIAVDWEQGARGLVVSVEQAKPELRTDAPTVAEAAAPLGLAWAMVDTALGPIRVVSTSRAMLLLPVREGGLGRIEPNGTAVQELCERYGAVAICAFSRSGDRQVDARQFPRDVAQTEVVGNGVAAGILGAYLTDMEVFEAKREGDHVAHVRQGRLLGRPTRIECRTEVRGGRIESVRVAGRATIDAVEEVDEGPKPQP